MKIVSIELHNFASYETLNFNFENQGLTLIAGPTGAGKSTLFDAIPWTLYGTTAKGGKADEILPWTGGNTSGYIALQDWGVVRKRGKINDLYISTPTGEIRGKDITDTQKLINQKLGVTPDLYLAGAYFHEFSQTSQFFTATPKNRRVICEQLVDLSMAKSLQEKSSIITKTVKQDLSKAESSLSASQQTHAYILKTAKSEIVRAQDWTKNQQKKIKDLKIQSNQFETDRENLIIKLESEHEADLIIQARPGVCSECGGPKSGTHNPTHSRYEAKIEAAKETINIYAQQLAPTIAEVNPYSKGVKDFSVDIDSNEELMAALESETSRLKESKVDLEVLSDVLSTFRGELVRSTIAMVENKTNSLLSEFFDAEIKVEFSILDAEKLDILIYKDGNEASYTQLSKGQRQLLKLCFGVSVMLAVENQHQGFNCLFFDEALDSLDSIMQAKAFRLLEGVSLSKESVFVVDHAEGLKTLFSNRFSVSLRDGKSQIEST